MCTKQLNAQTNKHFNTLYKEQVHYIWNIYEKCSMSIFQCYIIFVIACRICEISQIFQISTHIFTCVFKVRYFMPDDGPQDWNMYHIVTKLITFVVVYSNVIGSIDILIHCTTTRWLSQNELKTIILSLILTILFIHNNNNNSHLTQKI
jgi:hypothetical protein